MRTLIDKYSFCCYDILGDAFSKDGTAWKLFVLGVYLVRSFTHSEYLSEFSPNAGKYGPEKPRKTNSDTFLAVWITLPTLLIYLNTDTMTSVFWAYMALENEVPPCSEAVLEPLYLKMLQPYDKYICSATNTFKTPV